MKIFLISIVVLIALAGVGLYYYNNASSERAFVAEDARVLEEDQEPMVKNTQTDSQDLIVIVAPVAEEARNDSLFADIFQDVVDFDIAYANAVFGNDQVRILVDDDTRRYFTGKVPEEVLISADVKHIWARDFGTINPAQPVLFRYTPVTFEGDQDEADYMQDSFMTFVDQYGLAYDKTKYFLDGGNIVDSYAGRSVTTTRFLEDNKLSKEKGVAELKRLLNAREVAILPPDEEVMAHSDGMVMFADDDTIIVNRYDEPFRTEIFNELKQSFPGIKIVEIEAAWDDEQDESGNISSACGINLNATVTTDYIYMPHFGNKNSDKVQEIIQSHTTKTVIPIKAANKVCKLGGSVRCLTWQQRGEAAQKLLEFFQ